MRPYTKWDTRKVGINQQSNEESTALDVEIKNRLEGESATALHVRCSQEGSAQSTYGSMGKHIWSIGVMIR